MPDSTFIAPPRTRIHHDREKQGWILLTLCLAVLIAQIDTSVVNLAVRPIANFFHVRVASMQWLVDGYNLTYASLLLSGGLLADLFGRRRVFMSGALLFAVASLLCALAPTFALLVTGRVMAGMGAALLLPSSLAMIRVVWHDETARGKALGTWAGCNGLAFVIGPVVGGLLIQACGWRSIFFLTVPLGALACLLAFRVMPESADRDGRHVDATAQYLGIITLAGFTLAAIEGHEAPLVAMLTLAVSLLAAIGFVVVEKRHGEAALVPPGLLRTASFRGCVLATLGMTFGMYGVLFLLPMTWLATGRLGATGTGLALIPMALVFVISSPLSGSWCARFGLRTCVVSGLGLIAAGLVTVGFGAGHASLLPAEIGLALTGLGMGIATGPLMGGAVSAVSSARSGTAAAIINVARMVGATLGVAVLGTLYVTAGHGHAGLATALVAGAIVQVTMMLAAGRCLRNEQAGRDP